MRPFKFNLLENAIDSLRQGIGFVLKSEPTQSYLKLSILLIAQAVELLLKERLKREHWSLIFRNIEQAGNSNAITVTIEEAIKRLEQTANVRLEAGEQETISNLSNIRNRIQHHEIEITFEEVIGKAHAAIAFITRFLRDEFEIDIREHLNEEDIQELLSIEDVLNHLQEIAEQSIKRIQQEELPRKLADQVAWQFEIINCPECWQDYYVFSPDSNISQCQLCNYDGGFIQCARCSYQAPSGSWDFHSESPYALCDNCWADMQSE